MATTYDEYASKSTSEKNGLATIDAAERLVGWVLDSGTRFKITSFTRNKMIEVGKDGTALTEVATLGAVIDDTWFHDRPGGILYVQISTGDPTDLATFISGVFRLFFAEVPTIAPNDLSTGFEVEWVPLLNQIQSFGVELDNTEQLGTAIEGKGSLSFTNDLDFWRDLYDKVTFENQKAFIYSWSRELPITEAKLLFRGRVQEKSYTLQRIRFTLKDFLNELRSKIDLPSIATLSGERVPNNLKQARQRRLYGFINGFRPTNIDQVLDGFPLTGTVSITSGSITITGVGTQFLTDFSPNDELTIADVEDNVAIESIQSDTSATLNAEAAVTQAGKTFTITPGDREKAYTNRTHFVSGDTLKEPSTTISSVINARQFNVASPTDFFDGDRVIINTEEKTIQRIIGTKMVLTTNLLVFPTVSDVVTKPSIQRVFLNDRGLIRTRDFTVPTSNDRIELTETAERNIAIERVLQGTASFTTSSRAVTGTGTDFIRDLRSGDFIRNESELTSFEILQINSETSLDLRVVSTYTASGSVRFKSPNVYKEGETFLTCDCIGTTRGKTKTGFFPYRAADVIRDILEEGGLTSDLVVSTFDKGVIDADHRIGLVIPDNFNKTVTPQIRTTINQINKSVFGSLIQNNDFKLEYSILQPNKSLSTVLNVDENDILGNFSVKSVSKRIVKSVRINFKRLEIDKDALILSVSTEECENLNAKFLSNTSNTTEIDTVLFDQGSAIIFASRYCLFLSVANSVIKFKTKLQLARSKISDLVSFSHPQLYNRIGSNESIKIAAVQKAFKSSSETEIEIDDLANSFSRVAIITENTALEFSNASDTEKRFNGYITANDGIVELDRATFDSNIIW